MQLISEKLRSISHLLLPIIPSNQVNEVLKFLKVPTFSKVEPDFLNKTELKQRFKDPTLVYVKSSVSIFSVFDLKLNKEVILKFLALNSAESISEVKFTAYVQEIALLENSCNVIRLYDVVETESPEPLIRKDSTKFENEVRKEKAFLLTEIKRIKELGSSASQKDIKANNKRIEQFRLDESESTKLKAIKVEIAKVKTDLFSYDVLVLEKLQSDFTVYVRNTPSNPKIAILKAAGCIFQLLHVFNILDKYKICHKDITPRNFFLGIAEKKCKYLDYRITSDSYPKEVKLYIPLIPLEHRIIKLADFGLTKFKEKRGYWKSCNDLSFLLNYVISRFLEGLGDSKDANKLKALIERIKVDLKVKEILILENYLFDDIFIKLFAFKQS